MKLCLYVLLLIVSVPVCAMYFDIESQQYCLIDRSKKEHVVIDLPLKECALCLEDKHLVGSVPCEQGDKHPDVCDDCMHKLYEKEHACKGQCPFCKRKLTTDLACSICREKFKKKKEAMLNYGCLSCLVYIYKKIRFFN